MRKPKPHGPYSIEELSNMDDAELGRLYREKNRSNIEKMYSSILVDSSIGSMFIGLIVSLFLITPSLSLFVFISRWLILSVIGSACYPLYVRLRNAIRHRLGRDAFDDLYHHDPNLDEYGFKDAFEYLHDSEEENSNDNKNISSWSAMITEATKYINKDKTLTYSDEEVGKLLKIIIPVLSYVKNSNRLVDDAAFDVLDKEYNLTSRTQDFMAGPYNRLVNSEKAYHQEQLQNKNDQNREKAEQFIEQERKKRKKYAEGLAELEKSADYRKMMDLKRTLDEKKKKLSEQVQPIESDTKTNQQEP